MLTRSRAGLAASAVAVLTLVNGCGDDPVGPEITRADITQSFAAEIFTWRSGGTTIDLLAQGATLTITLHENGTTTGRLLVPGGAPDDGDIDVSLAGTFSFDDSKDEVTFQHVADTFVPDMPFTATRSGGVVRLRGERAFGSTTVRVVLRVSA